MCGIAGIISPNKKIVQQHSLQRMADTLAHRGPDGEGFWINENNNVGLAHRRLSIIDLSNAAAQPMHFAERYSIVYNGEIYNFKELKSDLQKQGYHFKTESDTEVILAAYDFYKNDCVHYFDGMFAFAIWDEQMQTLFCARDIFGEKPFYYFIDKSSFLFASEMKALWAVGINKTADEKMMVNYLTLGYVHDATNKSQTFFKEIFSLPPAHTGLFSLNDMSFTLTRYKDIDKETTIKITEKEAIEKLTNLLQTSINRRLRSDVPVGSSLSGGIDSSTIAYFIQQQNTNHSFKTFSAIFPGFEKDESNFIKELSEQFQCNNYGVTPNSKDLVNDFEKLCHHQEEPFLSSSNFAQYKVYELAKQHNVKVLLDGQGADEILGGYTKYVHWYLQELVAQHKFSFARKEKLAFQKNKMNLQWGIKNIVATYLPTYAALALERREYAKLMHNKNITANLLHAIKGNESQGIYKPVVTKLNDILYYNTMQSGLEELLRYADRNSMAHGIEVRLPFLNIDLVDFIFSLPSTFKMKDGFTKSILRKTMQNKLPNKILWNPIKTGFEPPQKLWMEDKNVQASINDAKQKLVTEKILKPAVLNNKVIAKHANDVDNMDWRYLSLAAVL
jgi:asparagine synthase (glutamine-hydrolysing)